MKITLSRDEIRGLIKDKYGITDDSFILEISSEGAKTSREVIEPEKPQQPDREPEVEFDITVDANGFITDMVPKNQPKSTVPFKDHLGRTWNYENVCKTCGKTFFSMAKPLDTCSKECMEAYRKAQKEAAKAEEAKAIQPKKKKTRRLPNKFTCTCKVCKKKFLSDSPAKLTCSEQCQEQLREMRTLGVIPQTKQNYRNFHSHVSGREVPKNPKLDYSIYGVKIEEFLASDQDFVVIDNENLTSSGMKDRYDIAARMFDLRDKISLSSNNHDNKLVMRKVAQQ